MKKLFNFIKRYAVIVALAVVMLGVFIWDIITRYIPKYLEYLEIIRPIYKTDMTFWVYYAVMTLLVSVVLLSIFTLYERHTIS